MFLIRVYLPLRCGLALYCDSRSYPWFTPQKLQDRSLRNLIRISSRFQNLLTYEILYSHSISQLTKAIQPQTKQNLNYTTDNETYVHVFVYNI